MIQARRRLRQLVSSIYQKFFDNDSQTYYYYNSKTGETKWEAPLGITDIFCTTEQNVLNIDEAAIKVQKLFRMRLAKKKLYKLISEVYQECYDEESGHFFFYNQKTGESSWSAPLVLSKIYNNHKEYYDEDNEKSYYYNIETGESRYTPPYLQK